LATPAYRLKNGRRRDPYAEALRFPSQVSIFRQLLADRDATPPTQRQYEDAVFDRVRLRAAEWERHAEGIMARASRTYISLVVQYHACLVLDERYHPVIWDERLDLRDGVDLLVMLDGGRSVGLALRSPTVRSDAEGERKSSSRPALPFPVVELVVQEREYVAGDFWLYRPETLFAAIEQGDAQWGARAYDESYEAGFRLGYEDGLTVVRTEAP
jgi:hypothetical protein